MVNIVDLFSLLHTDGLMTCVTWHGPFRPSIPPHLVKESTYLVLLWSVTPRRSATRVVRGGTSHLADRFLTLSNFQYTLLGHTCVCQTTCYMSHDILYGPYRSIVSPHLAKLLHINALNHSRILEEYTHESSYVRRFVQLHVAFHLAKVWLL